MSVAPTYIFAHSLIVSRKNDNWDGNKNSSSNSNNNSDNSQIRHSSSSCSKDNSDARKKTTMKKAIRSKLSKTKTNATAANLDTDYFT